MVIGIRGLVRGGVALAWFAALGVWGQEAPAAGALVSGLPESLSREVDAAMGRGAAYLLERQRENGSWQDMPAITGLACMGLRPCRLPQGDERRLAAIERGQGAPDQVVRGWRPGGRRHLHPGSRLCELLDGRLPVGPGGARASG